MITVKNKSRFLGDFLRRLHLRVMNLQNWLTTSSRTNLKWLRSKLDFEIPNGKRRVCVFLAPLIKLALMQQRGQEMEDVATNNKGVSKLNEYLLLLLPSPATYCEFTPPYDKQNRLWANSWWLETAMKWRPHHKFVLVIAKSECDRPVILNLTISRLFENVSVKENEYWLTLHTNTICTSKYHCWEFCTCRLEQTNRIPNSPVYYTGMTVYSNINHSHA